MMVDLHEMITKCELHWQPSDKRVLSMQQYNKLTFSAYNALLDMKDHAWEKSVNSNVFVIASRPWTCLGENMRLAMEKSVMRRLMFIQSINHIPLSMQMAHLLPTWTLLSYALHQKVLWWPNNVPNEWIWREER